MSLEDNKKLTVINILAGPGVLIGEFMDLVHKYICAKGDAYDKNYQHVTYW